MFHVKHQLLKMLIINSIEIGIEIYKADESIISIPVFFMQKFCLIYGIFLLQFKLFTMFHVEHCGCE